jgi:hypothetical protein
VADNDKSPSLSAPVLSEADAGGRAAQLTELRAALTALGIQSVLARRHRLVLRSDGGPYEQSGRTDPSLHIFIGTAMLVATTDGTAYTLAGLGQYPVSDPSAAAIVLVQLDCVGTRP